MAQIYPSVPQTQLQANSLNVSRLCIGYHSSPQHTKQSSTVYFQVQKAFDCMIGRKIKMGECELYIFPTEAKFFNENLDIVWARLPPHQVLQQS